MTAFHKKSFYFDKVQLWFAAVGLCQITTHNFHRSVNWSIDPVLLTFTVPSVRIHLKNHLMWASKPWSYFLDFFFSCFHIQFFLCDFHVLHNTRAMEIQVLAGLFIIWGVMYAWNIRKTINQTKLPEMLSETSRGINTANGGACCVFCLCEGPWQPTVSHTNITRPCWIQ